MTPDEEMSHKRSLVICSDYHPIQGGSRCSKYAGNGACGRDDRFMCEEWARRNPHLAPALNDVLDVQTSPKNVAQTGINGQSHEPQLETSSVPDSATVQDSGTDSSPPDAGSGKSYDIAHLVDVEKKRVLLSKPELLTEEAVADLSALGYETTVKTVHDQEITLVPGYTKKDRAEVSYKDARTLVMILQVFPGATIESLQKPSD